MNKQAKSIVGLVFPDERALYNQGDLHLKDCRFEGKEDGESALKEGEHLIAERCNFALRYPLWHCQDVSLLKSQFEASCRAPLWYDKNVKIEHSLIEGVKALRECQNVVMTNTKIHSEEFAWKCRSLTFTNSEIQSEYTLFMSSQIKATGCTFIGKYGFQYIKNATFSNCVFKTKDAFWHASDVVVKDSLIKGEYLGWYTKNLTLINCDIHGIQPLCYAKNLRLINCRCHNATFAFEFSSIHADLIGHIDSIKNPLKGVINADSIGEIIITETKKYRSRARIKVKKSAR